MFNNVLLKIELLNNEAYMSMIKSNYQIESSDLHPISNLLMEANAAAVASNSNMKAPYHQYHSAAHNNNNTNGALAPILVATNNLQNGAASNVISNG